MAIKGIVGAGGKLYLRTESGLHTLKNNGKESRDWDKAQFSSTPGEGPFMEFFFGEIYELVNTSTIEGKDREELRDAIMVMVTEGLLPAYEDLRAIRAYKDQQIPVLNRKKHYDDFVRALWHAYKDLMPKVAALLGYDIGFLFQRDGKFKTRLEGFVSENRDNLLLDVAEFLPRQRDGWQKELKTFRNEYLEHRDGDVAAQVEKFYEPAWAETVFVQAWRTAAELLVFLLETRFPPQMSIMHRTIERQFPNHPLLYEVYLCDPTQVQRRTFTRSLHKSTPGGLKEMEETTFQEITITPIRRTEDEPFRYRLRVNGNPPHMWTTPGIYNRPDEVVASFSPPLRVEYQTAILDMLRDGRK